MPLSILKRHISEMLGVISDTERLANDLSSVDLIPDSVKDEVRNTRNLSRYERASKLVNAFESYLKSCDTPQLLLQFCDVLKSQHDPALSRIAKVMVDELNKSSAKQQTV